MKNSLLSVGVFVAMCSLSAVIHAEGRTPTNGRSQLSSQEKAEQKAKKMAVMMEKVGGYVTKPGSQLGKVVYVNCQKQAPKEWIDASIGYLGEETGFCIEYKEGTFDISSPKIEGNVSLFIINDEGKPAILVAPEDRWAFVNVAVIAKEKRPAFFEARFKKQLTRCFAYLCGASNSQYPRCLTRGIVNEADLDKNPDFYLPIDVVQRFAPYMATLGVTPAVRKTYRKAVQEGWAPEPVNEQQRKIWNELHEVPTEPMVIKPEKHPVK